MYRLKQSLDGFVLTRIRYPAAKKAKKPKRERGKEGKRERGKEGKRERGKEGKRERGKEGKRERGKEGKRERDTRSKECHGLRMDVKVALSPEKKRKGGVQLIGTTFVYGAIK